MAPLGALAVLYYVVGKLGLTVAALPGNVTPVWPPTGLAIAALLLGGLRLWPAVAVGALMVNALSGVPLVPATGMAVGNTLEAVAGAWLFGRLVDGDLTLRRVRDVVAFTASAAVAATTLSATIGVASLYAGDVIPASALWSTWRVWWVGDLLGALVVAPLLLAWLRSKPTVGRRTFLRVEVAGFAAIAGALTIVLTGWHFEHPYGAFPALIWAALRWGQRGATAATAAISALAVFQTRAGHGAFDAGSTTDSLWLLASFLAVVAVTGLVLAAVVSERNEHMQHNTQLAAALRINVQELEYANKELEAFAYSVSHDLRAPLRNIDGFARNLVKRVGPDLDDEAQRHLSRIRSNVRSMGHLIDALLAFSRLQRQPMQIDPVDLNEVVGEALGLLEAARAGREITIAIEALPEVLGDRHLLVQVYLNLLGNAIKFTQRPSTPGAALIKVGSHVDPETDELVLFVADDGVGFDMEYAGKMFGVFQRLHRMEDYEGSGVGLALVERIVTRHGGRVWAHGVRDEGTTVSFTLRGMSL